MPLNLYNSVCYIEWVAQNLTRLNLWVSSEWFEGQRRRILLHRDMELTPEQSAEELRPFAEAALSTTYCDLRADFKAAMELSRKLTANQKGAR